MEPAEIGFHKEVAIPVRTRHQLLSVASTLRVQSFFLKFRFSTEFLIGKCKGCQLSSYQVLGAVEDNALPSPLHFWKTPFQPAKVLYSVGL